MPRMWNGRARGWSVKTRPDEENPKLKRLILNQIHRKGKIPFSEFMDLCLYHPDHGYYRTRGEKIGKEGDYYTSPCVHPVFGRLIGKQLQEMDSLLGEGAFWVIEVGAGRGNLAGDILDSIARKSPSLFERVTYGILEKNPVFIEEQKRKLAPYGERVVWLDLEGIQPRKLQGCLLANELIDAFPFHRITMRDGKLREIYVGEKGGTFSDILADPSSAEIPRYLDDLSIRLEEGQHAEINLEAVRWMDHVDRVLKRGFLLTIDYGFLAEDLYGPARFMGTMLCYYRHGYSDDPYIHIGVQDITAHVNFSSLIRKGESLGFHLTGLVPQYQFLLSLGFLEETERLETTLSTEEALAERLTMKNLILPDGGMGDTFKVLIQHRGVYPVQLSGLRLL